MNVSSQGRTLVAVGVAILALGVWGLWYDFAWIAQIFYLYGWWGFILVLDGFTAIRRGQSLFTRRRRHVLPIALWSVTFWFFFELLNLRFQNWYYVGVFRLENVAQLLLGGAFVVLCFATVFIGLFQTCDAVTATGLWARPRWADSRGRPGRFPPPVSYAVQALGAVMVGLAIAFPHYLAPLVWGSLTFLLDPWNYRHGARSILRDFEVRNFGAVARVLLAGLLCGVVWESFNFFAPQKWIYTVRGLESLKLFEMPLLGFLGFPALALDAIAVYSLISYWFLGNETWEHPDDVSSSLAPRPRASPGVQIATLPLHVIFWITVTYFVIQTNIGSLELELADLATVTPAAEKVLARNGLRRPRQLLRAAADPRHRDQLQRDLGYDEDELRGLLDEAELLTFKGIGSHHGTLLQRAGVSRIEDLASREPETLHARITAAAGHADLPTPRLDMVRVWVLAARSRGILMRGQ